VPFRRVSTSMTLLLSLSLSLSLRIEPLSRLRERGWGEGLLILLLLLLLKLLILRLTAVAVAFCLLEFPLSFNDFAVPSPQPLSQRERGSKAKAPHPPLRGTFFRREKGTAKALTPTPLPEGEGLKSNNKSPSRRERGFKSLTLLAHNRHRNFQRLFVIEPGINRGAISALQIGLGQRSRAAGAFGHVFAG